MHTTIRTRRRRQLAGVLAATATTAVVLTGCAGSQAAAPAQSAAASSTVSTSSTAAASPTTTSAGAGAVDVASAPVAAGVDTPAQADAALAMLDTLEVKGRAPKTGYGRDLFGQAWTDDVTVEGGRNGCDTRNDLLRRDFSAVVLKPGSNGCAVESGVLADPYTGTSIDFLRGQDTSSRVQIDHVVALSDAWQKGAQQLDPTRRRNFANDPRNLQATDGAVNQQKGDGDAATWLPPNTTYRCTYVARQVEVKAAYGLWVTAAEHDAIARVLGDCGATLAAVAPVPATDTHPADTTTAPAPVETPAPTPVYTPPPAPAYTPPPVPAEAPSTGASYANCAAARAAGAAPLYAGQPGYSSKLDRDGDGVACE